MPADLARTSLRRPLAVAATVAVLAGAATSSPAQAGGRLTVRLRAIGATTVAQGFPFQIEALAGNPGETTLNEMVVFAVTEVGTGRTMPATVWLATVPPHERLTTTIELTSSQWFTGVGTFEVAATVGGQGVGDPLPFEVTTPTVTPAVFEDVTLQAGLDVTVETSQCGAYAAGAAWGDVEGDGDLDLYLPNENQPGKLWINDGTGHFVDEAAARGVQNLDSRGMGAVFADYDNDGDPDLFVASNGPDQLYRNDGTGRFTDVALAAGVAGTTQDVSASWGDYDRDGFLDLYVVSNSPCLPPVFYEQDHLFHNEGDGTFTDQTALLDAGLTWGAGYQAAWFDFDHDGDEDLYLANDRWGPSPDANHLWRNDGPAGDGGWTFTEISDQSGAGYSINSMGIGIADVDGDADLDFAISNIAGNVLARNNGDGTFTDVAAEARIQRPYQRATLKAVTWGLDFVDLNVDGWEDLFLAAGAINDSPNEADQVFIAAGDGTFLDMSALSGADRLQSGRGVAVADYDRDGLPDLFVVNRGGKPVLWHNVSAATGHWLELSLIGSASNRDGCGARVTVTAGGRQQVREVFCGSVSLSSGHDPALHIGLGTAARADRVAIEWPSGRHQVLRDVAGDRVVAIVEPA